MGPLSPTRARSSPFPTLVPTPQHRFQPSSYRLPSVPKSRGARAWSVATAPRRLTFPHTNQWGLVSTPVWARWSPTRARSPLPNASAHPPTPFSTEFYRPSSVPGGVPGSPGLVRSNSPEAPHIPPYKPMGVGSDPVWAQLSPHLGSQPLPNASAHPPTPFSTEFYSAPLACPSPGELGPGP